MMRDVSTQHKPLVWLGGEVKTPPLSAAARIDRDAVVILDVFAKTSQATPKPTIELCKQRLRRYDEATKGKS